jgi:NAD(P)H-hydrate epimerase
MKIFSANQIRNWDQYTIEHEAIASIDLMERAATKCVEWLEVNGYSKKQFTIFCGKGNNGGDGLAMARILAQKGNKIVVYILEFGHKGSRDFQINLERLHQDPSIDIHFVQAENNLHELKDVIVIDALFGSGLSRPLDGITEKLVGHINKSGCEIISVDIPSGMFVDSSSKGNTIIKAKHTLSFQCYKPAFLVAENAEYIGQVHILDIGLSKEFYNSTKTDFELVDEKIIHDIYKPRDPFAHKGKYGHALLIAGGYGKMGAAILASQACLHSGVGLLTCHIPKSGYEIMQRSVPEAMTITDDNSSFITNINEDVSKFNTIGIGPGLGTETETINALKNLFSIYKKPIVIDADGLNCLSKDKELFSSLPPNSILTPHPKEFERLFGESKNDFERIDKALSNAKKLHVIIVLKGHHTLIATPSGYGYFNSTGNPGMAKGGSGDVLTGIITGLVAQGYNSEQATILGVYLHGLAGDISANKLSQEAMVASNIIENLGEAFKKIASYESE